MDAQNAVESANTKSAASPKRGVAESDDPKSTVTASSTNATTNNIKHLTTTKIPSATKDSRPATTLPNAQDDDVGPDQNSDAETIVLPGKDGISPSKPRKVIKHEDKSDGEIDDILPPPRKHLKDDRDGDRNGAPSDDALSSLERRKRQFGKEKQPRSKDASSGLSSAPASPPPHRRNNHDPIHRRRKSGGAHSESGSESAKSKSSKDPTKNKLNPDKLLLGKRKAPKAESDDEGESRKARRPRISDPSLDITVSAKERDSRTSSGRLHHDRHSTSRNRSLSPHGRPHRRSLSTQLPSQSSNGFSTKKRRVPAPLQSTEYHSDDSSASGSPHPRSSKLRSIATPVTGESTMSPARMPQHKKHVDNHGQTLLAKACAKGEYEVAKKRLTERPEDLNFADYAGNTPLQVASLNGHEPIVQLLIDAGCNLDCRNSDKETPLLDAVENGHLGVVKLLLKAGVNPRKADAEGHEPLEKVPDDLENAEEIRAALKEAKERVGELRRTSEDHQPHDLPDTLSSHGPESPRRSPTAPGSSTLAAQRRGGAVRSTKTSNHLLYMNLDDKTLRQAAARGDNETVTRVLQVKERCDDPEALVNAARGGHSFVVELLLALGGANADPRPLSSLPIEYGTPMLAAIGGENIEVIKLLLNAANFDPTRRLRGQTYYELARRREGPMWKEEEHLLKNAYDEYKKAPKGSKTKSPGRRDRELDQEARRANRNESNSDAVRPPKRRPSSPSREAEFKKRTSTSKVTGSPKEKRRSLSSGNHDEQTSPKRGPGRPKKEERASNLATSDREVSPALSKSQPGKSKLADSDLAAGSSDTETAIKPRRKLISGKDLKGHREKQRRASLASNNSANDRGDAKNDDAPEKRADRLSEKYHDRTKAIKRDESNDRLSFGESPGKRHRSSVTPPRHTSGDKDDSEIPVKRRKIDPESRERRQFQNSSPEDRQPKRGRDPSRDSAKRQRPTETDRKESSKAKKANRDRKELDKASPLEKASIVVASEDMDVEMRDAPHIQLASDSGAEAERERERERERKEAKKRQAEADAIAAEEAKKKEAERQQQEAERKKQEAEAKQQEEAEKKRLREEERIRLEKETKRREEEEKARLEEERKQREEQERREREEEERKRLEEEARIRREKEAAEEARRLQEEEERKERERKRAERVAAREAELQRARQEEAERLRLAKLPPLLRWLDGCPDPKRRDIAELFVKALGVRYDTIDQSATGKAEGREQWLLNTQVALLLGDKDTSLSRCESLRELIPNL